ncbi:hypothetical protein Ddc_01423 [Ditylenchus destructor]|nr:hypothetical protein Ddc_01423 [Ditylenchus destructor]
MFWLSSSCYAFSWSKLDHSTVLPLKPKSSITGRDIILMETELSLILTDKTALLAKMALWVETYMELGMDMGITVSGGHIQMDLDNNKPHKFHITTVLSGKVDGHIIESNECAPDTGYKTITTYGNTPVYRDSSLNLRGLDLARRYYDNYRSDSRCKYRTDGSSITIIDDSMERTATVSEQSQIETYKRRMRSYNAIHHPTAPGGFTQIYGGGLPFDTETRSAPIPPCFCAYCRVVVVEDNN